MERGPDESGPRFHFGHIFRCVSLCFTKLLNQILWRSLEKDARNLLMEVDEMQKIIVGRHEAH